jgi:hypothetical protein
MRQKLPRTLPLAYLFPVGVGSLRSCGEANTLVAMGELHVEKRHQSLHVRRIVKRIPVPVLANCTYDRHRNLRKVVHIINHVSNKMFSRSEKLNPFLTGVLHAARA